MGPPPNRMLMVLGLGIMAVFAGCGGVIEHDGGSYSGGRQRVASALEVPSQSLDFGVVSSTASFRWSVPFVNSGATTLDVASVSTTCGCVVLSEKDRAFVLAPRERRVLGLEIDLRGVPAPPGDARDFEVGISATLVSGEQLGWVLRGLVKDSFWLAEPRPIRITRVEGAAVDSVLVHFLHDPGIGSITVASDLHDVSASLRGAVAGGGFVVELKSSPSLDCGSVSGSLIVSGVQRDGKGSISSAWPVALETVPELALDPPVLHLGAIEHNVPLKFYYTVKSRLKGKPGALDFFVQEERNIKVRCLPRSEGVDLELEAAAAGECSFDLVIIEESGRGTAGKRTILHLSAEAY
jgi:hypothetical protein